MRYFFFSFLVFIFLVSGGIVVFGHEETVNAPLAAGGKAATKTITDVSADTQNEADIEADNDSSLLPGHPLYFFKQARERFEGWFAFGDVKKTLFFLKQAERRLNESRALLDRGKEELVSKNLDKYGDALQKTVSKSSEIKDRNGKNAQDVAERVSEATLKHQDILLSLYSRVAQSARPALEKALEASNRGYEQTLKVFSEEKRNDFLNKESEAREKIRGQIKSIQEKFDVKLPQTN